METVDRFPVISTSISKALKTKALNFLAKKHRVKKKFLDFIGVVDAKPLKKKIVLFNILDPNHPAYKSTKGFMVQQSYTQFIVSGVINRNRALRNLEVDFELKKLFRRMSISSLEGFRTLKEKDMGPYVIKTERGRPFPDEEEIEWDMAYTHDGTYIGEPDIAKYLFEDVGLDSVESTTSGGHCNIGFNSKEQKWYGWSHRAIFGFGIGDKIFEEEFGDDNTNYSEHGSKTITNLDEAKLSAIRFSEHVS